MTAKQWAMKTAKEAPVVGCVAFTATMFIAAMRNSDIGDVLYVFGGLLAILIAGYVACSAAIDLIIWAIKRKTEGLKHNEKHNG